MKKKINSTRWIIVILLGLWIILSMPLKSLAWVDQQEPYGDAAFTLAVGGGSYQTLAQVVTTGSSGYLRMIQMPVSCNGSDLLVEIQGVTDGMPDGTVLTSQVFPASIFPPTVDGTFVGVPFASPVYVTAGTSFAIVISNPTAPTGSCGCVPGPVASPYPGGDAFYDSRPNPPGWVRMLYNPGEPDRPDLPFRTIVTATSSEPVTDESASTFNVVPSAGQHGTIVCTPQSDIPLDSTVVCEITPDNNYFVDTVTVDGEYVGGYAEAFTFTFEGIDADHTISATFDNVPHAGGPPVKKAAAKKVSARKMNASVSKDDAIKLIVPEVSADGLLVVEKVADTTPLEQFKAVSDDSSHISFTGKLAEEAMICKKYNPEKVTKETELKLMHYADGVWKDITEYIDPENKMVCGKTASFSEFAVFEPALAPIPVAAFSYLQNFLNVRFDGSGSTCPSGSCAYSWDFGDSSAGLGIGPSHSYAADGTYQATLTVKDNVNLTQAQTTQGISVAANKPPVAAFAAGYPSLNVWTVTVKDASTDPDGDLSGSSAITVAWGNGSYSRCAAGGSVSYTYAVAGTYTITLRAADTAGLSDTVTAASPVTIGLGKVTGTVTLGGMPVNLAKVTITAAGLTKTAYTNTAGTYTIGNVKPGAGYQMKATKGAATYATQAWVTSGVGGTVSAGSNTVNFTP